MLNRSPRSAPSASFAGINTPLLQRSRRAIALAFASLALLAAPQPAQAQIQGDNTLGTQVNGSLTAPCTGACIITDGATRGRNLFHSFRQFSLPNGDFAGFVTTPTIQNVIVRVTGVGQPFISNINGTIATVNPTVTAINPANFFLINPNGIVFGPNASLLIGGSFLATTAEKMLFQDGTVFDARDQTVAPLLTINVPIGLQFNATPGNIRMQGAFLSAGNTDSFSDFALVGSDVSLDNTQILSPGRRVELGGSGTSGSVGMQLNNSDLSLSFPANALRSDVKLSNGSQIRVANDEGGNITINAFDIKLLGGSLLFSGINSGVGSLDSQAGDISLNASEAIQIDQSFISTRVLPGARGRSGKISINAGTLDITNGSQLSTSNFGFGDAGDVVIQARKKVALDESIIFSSGRSIIEGNSGDIAVIGLVQYSNSSE